MPEHINGNKVSPEKMQPSNRSLRSREMSEVISVKPGFIVNWGMFIMLLIVIAGILLTAFVKLPDTISMNIIEVDTAANNSDNYYGWGYIPAKSVRGIEPGQKVFIKINDQKDSSITEGKVEVIAALATDSGYKVTISFPGKGLVNANSSITKVSINTGKQSLLSKLFANLVPSFKNRSEK